jgi:hypothetical protein
MELVVSACCVCQVITGCVVSGELILIKEVCVDCSFNEDCGVKKNVGLFPISHGFCEPHFQERMAPK